jgi:hypothetical protein
LDHLRNLNQTTQAGAQPQPVLPPAPASLPQNNSCMEEIAALPLMDASHLRTQALHALMCFTGRN